MLLATQTTTIMLDASLSSFSSELQIPITEVCSCRFLASYFFRSVEVGIFSDEDGDGLGDAEETMIYTTTIANTGNVRVGGTRVSHLLAQESAIACEDGFEAATSADVRVFSVPSIR